MTDFWLIWFGGWLTGAGMGAMAAAVIQRVSKR